MHDELWAGIAVKAEHAFYHYIEMGRALEPPEQSHHNVALEASGAILDTRWRLRLFAHLGACLSALRSVPEIINCCFGEDAGSKEMREWFKQLSPAEQERRRGFSRQFRPLLEAFRDLLLSKARIDSDHRTGATAVEVTIAGQFGETYIASATQHVPLAEMRKIDDPNLAFLIKPVPLQRPTPSDFTLDGQSLFTLCREHIIRTQALISETRAIVGQMHGSEAITPPPSMKVRVQPEA